MIGSLLLAELPPAVDLKPLSPPPGMAGNLRDILLVTGLVAVLALLLFLFVYMSRRKRQGVASNGSRAIYRTESNRTEGGRLVEPGKGHRRRKKRRRGGEFEQRNPTLGETGGLPPLRAEEPADPASS